MSLAVALRELLASVEAGSGHAVLGFDDIHHWGSEARDSLVQLNLLAPAVAATSLECRGCEEHCFSEIMYSASVAGQSKPFILCEVPEKQAEMGRVAVQAERLQQWQCRTASIAQFLADRLGLDAVMDAEPDLQHIRLGMLTGPQGRRWAVLSINPLVLEVNQHSAPLEELLFVENDSVKLDTLRIQAFLAKDKQSTGKAYQPNQDRREARKQATEAMYQDWRDTHEQLLREHPGKSKSWYSQKIARMDVGQGKNPETIRKRLN
ncbi:MAG: hypothetical protein PsegKO_08310 [Pseudohongiellaceae bacterium]